MKRWMLELAVAWRTANQPCRENHRLHSLERDGEVSCGTRAGLRLHRVSCRGCRRLHTQLETMGELVRAYAGETDPPRNIGGMPRDVRERLAQRLGR